MDMTLIHPSTLPITKDQAFRKLKMIHRKVIAFHLMGESCSSIDQVLGRSGGYAANVLRNPTVKSVLEKAYEQFDIELKALVPIGIAALRRNMACGNNAVEVRATEVAFKANQMFEKDQSAVIGAEEVIERIMEQISADGTKTTYKERRVVGLQQSVQNLNADYDDNEVIDV